MRDEIIESMARTLFVTAYADAVEEGEMDGDCAGPGEDWMDVAPDVGAMIEARVVILAGQMIQAFERVNGGELEALAAEWIADTGCDADRFGHYLAMQSLGHGVGLNDDTSRIGRDWKTGYFCGLDIF